MGIFSKIAGTLLRPTLEKGCVDQYLKFLKLENEFNTEVLGCSDVNYATDVLRDFGSKYKIQVRSEFHGYLDVKNVFFEGQDYRFFIFMHYGRTINVACSIEINEDEIEKYLDFVDDVNKHDLLDQIGIKERQGKYYILVIRQLLCTPHIGDGDRIANDLRELKAFTTNLSHLIYSGDEAWMKAADVKATEPVDSAADFWFNQGLESCLHNFSSQAKLISNEDDREIHSMINIGASGDIMYFQSLPFLKGTIEVFKQLPYLSMIKVCLREGDQFVQHIDEYKAKEICKMWNIDLHLAPCKLIYEKDETGRSVLYMIMSCMYAEDTNTRTFVDILCTVQKLTGLLVGKLRK